MTEARDDGKTPFATARLNRLAFALHTTGWTCENRAGLMLCVRILSARRTLAWRFIRNHPPRRARFRNSSRRIHTTRAI